MPTAGPEVQGEESGHPTPELIFPRLASCKGQPWCSRIVHTAPGWSSRVSWEGHGSFWSQWSSPVTWGGSRSAFPAGWLPTHTEGNGDCEWLVHKSDCRTHKWKGQYCHCDITSALNACSTTETDCKSPLNSGPVISSAYPKQKPEALLGMWLERADKNTFVYFNIQFRKQHLNSSL